jgi:neuromedin U receptor 1
MANNNSSDSKWNVDAYLFEQWETQQQLPMALMLTITVIYVLLFVSGVVGNVVLCVVILRNRTMHTATNCYLFSLAVSDLTVLLLGILLN